MPWLSVAFLQLFFVLGGKFQDFTALITDNAALFQSFLVKGNHIAAGTLYFIKGAVLIADVEAFVVLLVLIVEVV